MQRADHRLVVEDLQHASFEGKPGRGLAKKVDHIARAEAVHSREKGRRIVNPQKSRPIGKDEVLAGCDCAGEFDGC